MKYQIGDKVKIKDSLALWKEYGGQLTVGNMIKYRGKVVTISAIEENKKYYKIQEDNGSFNWSEKMFCDEKVDYVSSFDMIKERYEEKKTNKDKAIAIRRILIDELIDYITDNRRSYEVIAAMFEDYKFVNEIVYWSENIDSLDLCENAEIKRLVLEDEAD